MHVYAICHVAFEDLGLLEPLLVERDAAIAYGDAWAIDRDAARAADLLVILGGPISANDTAAYQFLDTEIALARERLKAGRSLLGICLGAQIVARAAGGAVGPAPEPEIGWGPVRLTQAGQASVLRHLDGVPVLHWHGENCKVPGFASLAETDACAVQAFQPTEAAVALQFHSEAGANGIEPWLVGHCHEIGATPGVSVPALRRDSADHGPRLQEAARAMFSEWLDNLGLKGGRA